jgi:hypothetical protein
VTWFKVDDTLSAHPKARAAGLPAMGLWVVAGAYASQYLTEGFVPGWYVDSWPSGKKLAARLVDAGLWETTEGGWMFHQWGERQPTKEQVEADRAKTRERQQRWRDAKRDERLADAVSNGSRNGVTDGVTNASPTRPDPTRPTNYIPPVAGQARAAPSAQPLLTEWINQCGDEKPPARVKGQVAKELGAMLAEGIPVEDVRGGLAAWHAKGLHPSALASVVHEQRTAGQRNGIKPSTTDERVAAGLALVRKYEALEELEHTDHPPAIGH